MIQAESSNQITAGLNGFFTNYAAEMTKNMLAEVLGKALDYVPIDTKNLVHNTLQEEDSTGPYLISRAIYARTQYWDTRRHWIVAGKFRSIGKALIGKDAVFKKTVRELKGGGKFKAVYWHNFEKLAEANQLTPLDAKWFHRAFDDLMQNGFINENDAAVEKAQREALRMAKTTIEV